MTARERWITASELMRSWRFRVAPDRLAILSAVWEKEMGHLSRHWRLQGVRGGILYVAPRSAAAGLELRARSSDIVRSLNKYFRTAWIKEIKASISRQSRHDQGKT